MQDFEILDIFNFGVADTYDITRNVKLLYNGEKVEKTLSFREVEYEVARRMITKNHYSKKWNANFGNINIGIFENSKLLGVAVFGNLMHPKSYKLFNDSFEQENVVELNRLWVCDSLGGNAETVLMRASFDIIRLKYPEIKAIQSFADGRLGVGTIYKAMNFNYYGFVESVFYEDIKTGEVHHHVPMTNTMRPQGMIKLNTLMTQNRLRAFKVKTYRYVYPLYKDVKIELVKEPYPKYEKGIEYIDDHEHNDNVVARAFILAFLLSYFKEKDLLFNYLKENNALHYILSEINNESVERIVSERNVYIKMIELQNFIKDLGGQDE